MGTPPINRACVSALVVSAPISGARSVYVELGRAWTKCSSASCRYTVPVCMRPATIPAPYVAASGTTPHTAALVSPICAKRFHRHYKRATCTIEGTTTVVEIYQSGREYNRRFLFISDFKKISKGYYITARWYLTVFDILP